MSKLNTQLLGRTEVLAGLQQQLEHVNADLQDACELAGDQVGSCEPDIAIISGVHVVVTT